MIFLHYSFICVNLLSSSSSLFSSLILSLLSMSLSSSSSFKSVWACDSKKVWHLILLKQTNFKSSSSSLLASLMLSSTSLLSLLSSLLSLSSSSLKSGQVCGSEKVWHLILLKKKFHCHPHPPPCCPPWCCCRHWHCCCCCHPHHHSRVGSRGRSSRKPQVSIKFRSWEIWKVEKIVNRPTNRQRDLYYLLVAEKNKAGVACTFWCVKVCHLQPRCSGVVLNWSWIPDDAIRHSPTGGVNGTISRKTRFKIKMVTFSSRIKLRDFFKSGKIIWTMIVLYIQLALY